MPANLLPCRNTWANATAIAHKNILAWYALIKILVSWLSLGLFSGGVLVRQILGIPMWQSTIALVLFSGLFTFAGGLKAIAKVNVFQMILLIAVSAIISYLGLKQVGGVSEIMHHTPANFWNLIKPNTDADFHGWLFYWVIL
ncbi:MAG: hypothetical protein WDM90_06635 [Ferruginibacter sp.]